MKFMTLLLLLVGMTSAAQIQGNKSIETRNFDAFNIKIVKINLYAKVTIDQAAQEGLSITTDSNLFDLINTEVIDGILHLDQKKWISASQDIRITIGAPNLNRVESGTHDITKIINVNNDQLRVNAPIGNISIEGKTKELRLGSELSTIDASKLTAENAYINIWGDGNITVNVSNTLWADVSNDGHLMYLERPKKLETKVSNGGRVQSIDESRKTKNNKASYISFKIKNNSANRNHFYVLGPKPDGSKFSYGFPMMPYAKRDENWTIGTKVFKVDKLGFKILLITITEDNKNQIVNLFN